jgi:hypothetical protein
MDARTSCACRHAFRHETFYDDKLFLRGETRPGMANLVRAGVFGRRIGVGSLRTS